MPEAYFTLDIGSAFPSAMAIHQERPRPPTWQSLGKQQRSKWLFPLFALDWSLAWFAHVLSRWVLLEVLEYLSTFSVLAVVIFYFSESGDRRKQKHYQAWHVSNTAQGKGASGRRIEALQELNADHVPLVGVDLTDAFLYGVNLDKAQLPRSTSVPPIYALARFNPPISPMPISTLLTCAQATSNMPI